MGPAQVQQFAAELVGNVDQPSLTRPRLPGVLAERGERVIPFQQHGHSVRCRHNPRHRRPDEDRMYGRWVLDRLATGTQVRVNRRGMTNLFDGPDGCTLPTAELPLRRAEFDDLFGTAVARDRLG